MTWAPASQALATAMALARSFRAPVGFWPSSFTQSFFNPQHFRQAGLLVQRAPPHPQGRGRRVLLYRQQLR